MAFDTKAARQAGYSDDEIAEFLSKEVGFDLGGARKAGYSATEIIDGLSAELGKQKPLPEGVQPAAGRMVNDPRRTDAPVDRGLLGTMSDSLARGVPGLMQGFSGTGLRANAGILAKLDEIEQKLAAGRKPETFTGDEDPYGAAWMSPEQRAELRAQSESAATGQASSIAAAEATKADYPAPPVVDRVMKAKTWGEALSAFAGDPVQFVAAIGPESLVTSAPGLIGAAISPGGAAAKAAVMGVGSGATDYGSQIISGLQREGVDLTDPEAVRTAAKDADLMRRIAGQAMAHAGPVAALDAASGGMASKMLLPAGRLASRPVAREVANLAIQTPAQGLAGGAGEALGAVASGQEIEPGNVLAEVVGEGFGAPAEVATIGGRAVAGRVAQPAGATSFTEPDSPSAKAGLTPIVVPVPAAEPMVEEIPSGGDAGAPGVVAGEGGGPGGAVDAGGVAAAGRDPGVPGVRDLPAATVAAGAADAPVRGGAEERPGALTNPAARASDAELLAAADAETTKNAEAARANALRANDKAIADANAFIEKSHKQLEAAQATGDNDMVVVARQNLSTGRGRLNTLMNERTALVAQGDADGQQAGSAGPAVAAGTGEDVRGAASAPEGGDRVAPVQVGDRPERAGRAAEVGDLEPSRVRQVLNRIENARLKMGQAVKLEQVKAGFSLGADVSAKIARVLGAPIVFVRATKGKASFQGAHVDGIVVIRADNKHEVPHVVTMHEVVHSMPSDIKQTLIARIKPTFKNTDVFKEAYGYNDGNLDEELTAVLAQQHSKTPEFWRELRSKMGDGEFAKLADYVLEKLDTLLKGFKKDDLSEFSSDVEAVRAALTDAYAQTAQRRGTATAVDEGAHAAALSPNNDLAEPTDAQKKAGNYKVGRVRLAGLDISIENPEGSVRSGKSPDGKAWRTEMKDHYGYIRGTVGKDKDHVDVFIKPGTDTDFAGSVWVVDQRDPRTGEFDEHKVIVGATSEAEAREIYARNYSKGWEGLGSITEMPMDGFKEWLDSGDTVMPADPAFSERRADFTDPEERVEVSTTRPRAKGLEDQAYEKKLVIDGDDVRKSERHVKAIVDALRRYNTLSGKGNAKQLMQELHDTVVKNLLWLHDLVPADVRARAKLWYDGANRIASEWQTVYGVSKRQASGVLAVLSPQMDWFKNVSLAERVINVVRKRGDEKWSPAMTAWVQSWVNASKTVQEKAARGKVLEIAKRLEGRTLNSMDVDDAAKFVRVFDETYHERRYRLVTPEGGFGDYVTKSDDGESAVTWGGFDTIGKAISILRDGSFRNVEAKLGDEHKVRNFFNNIISPQSGDGHVTIDTHAVAAALIKGLSGSSPEVADNFGAAGSSAETGASGTYGLFADAYRDAAQQRGILPREMQSITWEAVRALFPAAIKDKISGSIDKVWDRFKAGEITREQAREEVMKIAGGIRPMAWEGGDEGSFASDGATSFDTEIAADPKDRAERVLDPVDTKDRIAVSLSAATTSIPGIAELYARAGKGDEYAHTLLQDIALDSLRHLMAGTSARIKEQRATGLYGGQAEPSLGLNIAFTDVDRDTVLAALAKFAENFNQEQVHVRQSTKDKLGTSYPDGSYSTPVWRWTLAKALSRKEIQRIIDKSGLYGLTFGDDFVEAYYVGDPSDQAAIDAFEAGAGRVNLAIGKNGSKVGREAARLWAYGRGEGAAVGFDRIRGELAAGPAAANDTARRIAEYLNQGSKVKTFEQATDVTPEQAALQRKIAAAYEALPDNDLKNPRVKRAYQELVKEVVRQYKALPVKVEVLNGQGEPYKNSAEMRRDVLDNNHLFIFGTTIDTFGPPGVDFSGHPLLGDSGLTDGNGYKLLLNDLLRAVHDYFAHNLSATQFGPKGEEAAWKNHMASTANPWARWALTSETRGQNSWVNFNPAADGVPVKDRPFARQKAALLPVEYSLTGDRVVDAPMKEFIAALPVSQRVGSKPERDVEFLEQRDLFPGEFASKRATTETGRVISSKGETERGGNVDSAGRQISSTKQGLANFWKWFGNSEVVNDDGRPLVLYHSTNADVSTLSPGRKTTNNYGLLGDVEVSRAGVFLTPDRDLSQEYLREGSGQNVMPMYARIENALDLRSGLSERDEQALERAGVNIRYVINIQNYWELFDNADDGTNDFVDGMKRAGYDGAIFREASPSGEGAGGTTYMVLESGQLKSAIGNRGTFSPDDARIDFSEARDVTETPEFKRWFGDSKVVDAEGRPLVVYHGTSSPVDFKDFKRGRDLGVHFGSSGQANERLRVLHRNDAEDQAYSGARVIPVYLSIKNPLRLDDAGDWSNIRSVLPILDRTLKGDDWVDVIQARNIKQVREALQRRGYDGIVYKNTAEVPGSEQLAEAVRTANGRTGKADAERKYDEFMHANAADSWLAFEPSQIKSATSNRGTFDPADARIDFANTRRSSTGYGQQLTNAFGFPLGDETRTQKFRRIVQDYFLRMQTVQEAVLRGGGIVDERRNVYRAEERMYGRVQSQLDDFAKGWVEPMLEKAAKAGIDLDELALYAYAKHAPERNAHIDTINPKLQGKGSGMSNADAAAVIAKIPAGKLQAFEDLRQDLLAITETTRRVLLDEGLITQDEYDAWTNQYQDYVPLRGFDVVNDETGTIRPGSGRGFNIRGKESLKALGRASRAGDIIEHIVRDYQRAVIRAERNAVGKVFLDLVTSNPDPTLWEVNATTPKRSQNRLTGMVSLSMETDKGPDTVAVKVGGREVYIRVHDELLLRAMRKAAVDESGQMQRALAVSLGAYNDWMRNTLTRYNPVFAFTNSFKDAQTGAVSTLDTLGAGAVAKYAGYYRAAMAASFRNETRSLGQTGRFWGDPAMDKAFEEFKAAGGTTGGWFLRDPAEIERDLRQLMVAAGAAPRTAGERITGSRAWQGAKAALRYVEMFGAASENASRLAAYRTARDLGKTPAEAASIAKNLTTNFNRKGEWGTGLNSLYLFFNAAMQGTTRTLQALGNPKVMALMAGVTATAAGVALANAGMGGDDDDGQAYWDKIPAYEKERSFIFMLPPGEQLDGAERVGKLGRYVKIPMPYGFNVFPVLGYQMADLARYAHDRNRGVSPGRAAIHMVSAVAGSYNPLGGSFDPTDPVQAGMAVAPTVVDAGIQLATGTNNFGRPVGPAKSPFDTRPDAERFTPAQAGTPSQKLARWLNETTGGTTARSGAIDIMPGTIDNVVRLATGGVGTFLRDVFVNMPTKLVDPEAQTRARDVPFLRNVFGQVDESVDRGLYYDRIREVSTEARTALNEMKLGIDVKYDERSRGLQALGGAAKSYTEMMASLRKEELRIVDDPDLTADQKKAERRDVEKRRNEFVRQFNELYLETMGDVNAGRFAD